MKETVTFFFLFSLFFFFFSFQLFQLLVPKEKYDKSHVILEVTAGRTTGGQQNLRSKDYSKPPSKFLRLLWVILNALLYFNGIK